MELIYKWMTLVNDALWTYILIAMLMGCAVWFTLKTRFVQFRMIREMIRLLGDSAGRGDKGEKHISSFQAFAISLASRVGSRQSGRSSNSYCRGRSRSHILDVGHRAIGCFECFRRVHPGTIIWLKEKTPL